MNRRCIALSAVVLLVLAAGTLFYGVSERPELFMKAKCLAAGHEWEANFAPGWGWKTDGSSPDERYPHGYKYRYRSDHVKCARCGSFLYNSPVVDAEIYPLKKGEIIEKNSGVLCSRYRTDGLRPLNGEYIYTFEDGTPSGRWSYKNGKLEGICREYYKDGSLRAIWNASGDKMNGLAKFYHLGLELRWEGSYEKGRLYGKTREFFEDGQLKREDEFINGVSNGTSLLYYKNGQLKWMREHKNGLRDGETIEYFEDGKIFRQGTFLEGKGKFTVYGADGKPEKYGYYNNGKVEYSLLNERD